jgi:hypothetical protein
MEVRAEEPLKTGLSRSANRLIFALSLGLIAIGAYGLFASKHAALIFSIFAVAGLIIPALSLFIAFPIWPIAEESRPAAGAAPAAGLSPPPSRPATLTATRVTTAKLPVAYGLAFSVAGVLLILNSMIAFSGGTYSSPEIFANAAICGIIADALLAFGFPGFHALQASKGGYTSLIGSALGVATAIAAILDLWLREDALADGIGTTPSSYHSLALTLQAVGMFASVLIAIAIIKAGVYPPWTAGAKLLDAFLSLVFIMLNGNYGAFMLTVYRLDGLLQGAVLLVFARRMLDLQVKRAS